MLDPLYSVLHEMGIGDYKRISKVRIVEVRFQTDDARRHEFKKRIQALGYEVAERTRVQYLRDDVEGSLACIIRIMVKPRSVQPVERYDLARGCPRCGTGCDLSDDLVVPKNVLPKRGHFAETLEGYILCTAVIRKLCMESGASEADFTNVQHADGSAGEWWRMWPFRTVSRLSTETLGLARYRGCTVCGRDGFFESSEHDFVPRLEHNPESTFVMGRTWEYFGTSNLTGLEMHRYPLAAAPRIVLGRPLASIMFGMQNVQLIPIF